MLLLVAPTVRLATDIAVQFHHVPSDEGAAAVANHIRLLCDPRMRRQLHAELDAGADVDPLVAAAALLSTGTRSLIMGRTSLAGRCERRFAHDQHRALDVGGDRWGG